VVLADLPIRFRWWPKQNKRISRYHVGRQWQTGRRFILASTAACDPKRTLRSRLHESPYVGRPASRQASCKGSANAAGSARAAQNPAELNEGCNARTRDAAAFASSNRPKFSQGRRQEAVRDAEVGPGLDGTTGGVYRLLISSSQEKSYGEGVMRVEVRAILSWAQSKRALAIINGALGLAAIG
jgi:hypothetical protein